MRDIVYFDNNATTMVAPEVLDAMLPFFKNLWGNPSSMHYFGGKVAKYIKEAREQVANLINAEPDEIIFTSCGTESNNTAIKSVASIFGKKLRIVTSRVEHHAVLEPCKELRQEGYDVVEIGVDEQGHLQMDQFDDAIKVNPLFVSIMWANNETGVIFPIEEIACKVKERGGILHIDAVQAIGKIPVDVKKIPVDMLSISGHKFHAPKGIGILYLRRGTPFKPLFLGGHQENGRRAGTENVPYIVGIGKASELAKRHLDNGEMQRVAYLRDKLEEGLLKSCPNTRVNGDRRCRVPNTTNIGFEFIEGEAILYSLSDINIAASSGSACTSGSLEPSHVLRAMGVPFTVVHGSIRFSLSVYTTEEEIDYALSNIPKVIAHLREISPFG